MSSRRSRDELRASMQAHVNSTRRLADEMALMYGGCDDSTWPFTLNLFRDVDDFVERVARPIVESEDGGTEQAALALYRKASPALICAGLVVLANRVDALTQEDGQ